MPKALARVDKEGEFDQAFGSFLLSSVIALMFWALALLAFNDYVSAFAIGFTLFVICFGFLSGKLPEVLHNLASRLKVSE